MRLLAQRHDLQLWTAEPSAPTNPWSRPYPSGLSAEEGWAAAVLRPWLELALRDVALMLPPRRAQPPEGVAAKGVVHLLGLSRPPPPPPPPRDGKPPPQSRSASTSSWSPTLKHVVLFEQPPLVLVFDVVSWGRQPYRTLVFTSDASRSLHEPPAEALHASLASPSLPPCRGDPTSLVTPCASLRISRDEPGHVASQQTFVPYRFLLGLLPDGLLHQ